MRDTRIHRLLSHELDGTLSDIERSELDRRALLDPETRRERATWSRVMSAIAGSGRARRLRVEALAVRIIRGVQQRGAAPLDRLRQMVLAASLATAGFALFAFPVPTAPLIEQPKVAALTTSPVEVALDELEEPDAQPVVIRF